jgi:preprotein translocase subunit SecD
MFRINRWKLSLIILILLFSALYILPTPSSTYGPLYGYFEVWMQREIPYPTVTDDGAIRFDLSKVKLPAGVDLYEAIDKIQTILKSRLEALGISEDQISFLTTEQRELLVKVEGMEKRNMEEILPKLQLYGKIPLSLRPLIPDKRLNLGLDLKGGVYLVLELDMKESKRALLEERRLQLRDQLRSERVLASSIEAREDQDALLVTVRVPPGLSQSEREEYLKQAERILSEQRFFSSPRRISEKQNEIKYMVKLSQDGLKEYTEDAIDRVLDVLRNRIDAFGVAEPSIRKVPNQPRIIVQLPGAKDSSQALNVVKRMGRLEFKLVADGPGGSAWVGDANTPPPETIPDNTEIRYSPEGNWYVLKKETLLTGERIRSAGVGQRGFGYVVLLSFDSAGTRRFADITGNNVGKHLAILLDGKVQSAPVISEKITRGAEIRGNFTPQEANDLARILRAGAFPVGVKVGEERTVGPMLGRESIARGVKAAAIGLSLVVLFMVFYYRISGIIAVIALLMNMVILIAALAGFGATLTLPGLAGLVLTVGMAVDANVLIFERIREEIRSGKTVRSAVDSGYRRTLWTILDANITTLLTALVLYQFGTGPVKGFAVTLSLGILASMFTALFVTREIYNVIYHGRTVKRLSI